MGIEPPDSQWAAIPFPRRFRYSYPRLARQLTIGGPLTARLQLLVPLMLLFSVSGCDDDPERRATARPRAEPQPPGTQSLRRARCPADAAPGCRSASGRVTYVEAVDPDGDGDAHLVLVSRQGLTAPGISVIDVRRGLRPRPLPRIGDRVSAAGPVYTGSYGQRQIEAVELHVARAGPD